MSNSNLTRIFHNNGSYTGNATLVLNPYLCTLDTCDLSLASFVYLPTVAGNSIYAGIFGVWIIGNLFLGIKYKTLGFTFAIILGLALEVVGYIARVLLHDSPFDHDDFLIYLITLTIAPAFLTASIYLCLCRIVIVYGENLSRFKPRTYTFIFCTCDFICLVLQGLGGGIAATANTTSASNLGKNIMLAGLIFQVVSLVLFIICAGEFAFRVHKSRGMWNPKYINFVNSKLFKQFLLALFVATIAILARCIYRCAELAGGFNSTLFTSDQVLFMVLEGAMIVLATTCLTVSHPGIAFQGIWGEANFSFKGKNGSNEKFSSGSGSGSFDEENGRHPVQVQQIMVNK